MATLNFDANEVDPAVGFEPLPAGKYKAVITESEMKATKSGTGQYLELKMQVIEGPHANRMLFDRLNLTNPSQQAVEIARSTLSAICHAVGVLKPTDSYQLHDKPLLVKVVCRKREDNGEMSNEVKGYEKVGAAAATAAAGGNGAEAPPWKR